MTEEVVMGMGAIIVELGLPVALLALAMFNLKLRPKAIVMLGALSPMLCVYGAIGFSYLFSWKNADMFALYAMWVMTFAVYVGIALGGLAASFLRRPKGSFARFSMGVLTVPISYFAFVHLVTAIFRY